MQGELTEGQSVSNCDADCGKSLSALIHCLHSVFSLKLKLFYLTFTITSNICLCCTVEETFFCTVKGLQFGLLYNEKLNDFSVIRFEMN